MDTEFHYYITGIIARRAGFSERDACVIAHSSQLVDDNTESLGTIQDRKRPGDEPYKVYISQTMNVLKPRDDLMRIYSIFHFLPGNPLARSARRSDGKMHILITTPGNKLARKVMRAAEADHGPHRLHRLGVAAHAFADTWAHQNFIGWKDGINGREDMKMVPNIGHADFMDDPDMVGHTWWDERLIAGEIENNARFLDAARHLFHEFCAINKTDGADLWPALEEDLEEAMSFVFESERIKAYSKLFKMPQYNRDAWLNRAVRTEVDDELFIDVFSWKGDWKNSHWYLFQEAIKAHQAFCMEKLAPIFRQMNVNLHDH